MGTRIAEAVARLFARVGEALASRARRAGAALGRALAALGHGLLAAVRGLLERLRPRRLLGAWRLLGPEQRVAAAGCVLLVASTPGPFSFVEAAEILVALAIVAMLYARSERRPFHLPFGDGAWVAVAGTWCTVLILSRLLERPFGQNLLALACAGLVVAAGIREHARRPADDMPRGPRVAPPGAATGASRRVR